MCSTTFFFLQIGTTPGADFVMKAGLLVILLCGFIIYLTIRHRFRKNRMFIEQKMQEERYNQEILNSRIEVQEATLTSVGIELHDNVAQLLNTTLVLVNVTEQRLGSMAPTTLKAAAIALNKSIDELRSVAKSLSKDWLEQFDIKQNLQAEIDRIHQSGDLLINLMIESEDLVLSPEEQFLLFRVIQEGIQNVLRHAGANMLSIAILSKTGHAEIIIRDNGKGFDPKIKSTGIGIPNIRQRVNALKGSVNWNSNNSGTIMQITIPLKKSAL